MIGKSNKQILNIYIYIYIYIRNPQIIKKPVDQMREG